MWNEKPLIQIGQILYKDNGQQVTVAKIEDESFTVDDAGILLKQGFETIGRQLFLKKPLLYKEKILFRTNGELVKFIKKYGKNVLLVNSDGSKDYCEGSTIGTNIFHFDPTDDSRLFIGQNLYTKKGEIVELLEIIKDKIIVAYNGKKYTRTKANLEQTLFITNPALDYTDSDERLDDSEMADKEPAYEEIDKEYRLTAYDEEFQYIWQELLQDKLLVDETFRTPSGRPFRYRIEGRRLIAYEDQDKIILKAEIDMQDIKDAYLLLHEREYIDLSDFITSLKATGSQDKFIDYASHILFTIKEEYLSQNPKSDQQEDIAAPDIEDAFLNIDFTETQGFLNVSATKRYLNDIDKLENNWKAKADKIVEELSSLNETTFSDYLNRKRLKKFQGDNRGYYKFRVDNSSDAHRIICSFGDARYPNSIVLRAYVRQHDRQGKIARNLADDDHSIIELTSIEQQDKDILKTTPIHHAATEEIYRYNNNKFVPVLTDYQLQVTKLDPPLIVKGSAGSGKTLISIEIYNRLVNEGRDTYYVTFTQSLVEYAKNEYIKHYSSNTLHFYKLDHFLREKAGLGASIGIINYDDFTIWKDSKYLKSNRKEKRIESRMAWVCIRGVIKGKSQEQPMIPLTDFLKFAKDEKIDEEEARLIYNIADDYEKWRLHEGKYDDNDLAREVLAIKTIDKCQSMVIDEIQDLTYIQVQAIVSCMNTQDIYFIGDPNQMINPTILKFGEIKTIADSQIENTNCRNETLKDTYRMGKGLMSFVNYLSTLRKKYIGYQDSSDDEDDVSYRDDDEGLWAIRTNQEKTIDYLLNIVAANYIIVVYSEKEREELIRKYPENKHFGDRIETIFSIKGREYDNVVLYNIVSSNIDRFKSILEMKAKQQTFYRMLFNVLYVGCTRARNLLIFCEEDPDSIMETIYKDIDIKNSIKTLGVYLELEDSEEDWLDDARANESFGRYKPAVIAYKKASQIGMTNEYEKDIRRCELLHLDEETSSLSGDTKLKRRREIAVDLYDLCQYEKALQIFQEINDSYHIFLIKLQLNELPARAEVEGFVADPQFASCSEDNWELIMKNMILPGLESQKEVNINIEQLLEVVD